MTDGSTVHREHRLDGSTLSTVPMTIFTCFSHDWQTLAARIRSGSSELSRPMVDIGNLLQVSCRRAAHLGLLEEDLQALDLEHHSLLEQDRMESLLLLLADHHLEDLLGCRLVYPWESLVKDLQAQARQ